MKPRRRRTYAGYGRSRRRITGSIPVFLMTAVSNGRAEKEIINVYRVQISTTGV